MAERERQILSAYARHRVREQLDGFYRPTAAEYRAARRQVIICSATLLSLGGVAGVLAAAGVAGATPLWAVLATAFPALATAISAYDGVYAFERVARLYENAIAALDAVEAPDAGAVDADPRTLIAYVEAIESVLMRERGQWGQLASGVDLVQPPAPRT